MENSTEPTVQLLPRTTLLIVSYIPIFLIILGLSGNTISFFLFTFHGRLKNLSSMVFLSLIAVFNIFGLFTWNLDHFTGPQFNWYIAYQNMFTCRFFVFIQYACLQISGLLYSLVSVDRYFQIMSIPGSFISRLPFGTRRSAYGWSVFVIVIIFLLNGHLLIFNGYIETKIINDSMLITHTLPNGTLVVNKTLFNVYTKDIVRCYASYYYEISPLWDKAQSVVYTFIPFFIMLIFNTLLIVNVLQKKRSTATSKTIKQNKKLTVSLIMLTLSFLILTAPGSVGYGFFLDYLYNPEAGHKAVAICLDSLMFFQQTILFYVSYVSNKRFREVVKEIFCRRTPKDHETKTANLTRTTQADKN